MTPTLVERLRALLGFGDRRTRTKLGIPDRRGSDLGADCNHIHCGQPWNAPEHRCVFNVDVPHRLVLRCAGCGGTFGMVEPNDATYGKASLFFCTRG
jgi:hypothetical protein